MNWSTEYERYLFPGSPLMSSHASVSGYLFRFFNYDPLNDKQIQTLRVFCMLLLCCFFLPSSSRLSVSKQRSGSCYSHSSPALTAAARHVSILHWRRTRRGVNTTVQRERQRRRGGRTGEKMRTETQDANKADAKERVRMWPKFKTKGTKTERQRRTNSRVWANRLGQVLTQNYPVG